MSYLTCKECRSDGRCAWGPGCGVPKIREFQGYAPVRIGIFFYKSIDKNFVMDDFGTATPVPPPVQRFPFTERFQVTDMGSA